MSSAIMAVRSVIDSAKIKVGSAPLPNLRYVKGLKQVPIDDSEITWVSQREDFGMSPIVSAMQNSPVLSSGGYDQFKSAPIISRHVKRFTDKELKDVLSPDDRYRIAVEHTIEREFKDSTRRMLNTYEFVAHSAITRGSLKYVNNDPENRLNVDISFPITTATATVLWDHKTNGVYDADIIGQMKTALSDHKRRGFRKPKAIRLTTRVWDIVTDNPGIKTVIGTYLRVNPGEMRASEGIITPQIVSAALNWPPIEIDDEQNSVSFTTKNAETAGNSVVIELNGGTFGLNVGDEIMVGYIPTTRLGIENCTITAINHGVSVTVATLNNNTAAGTLVVAKPTFFPSNRIMFVPETEMTDNYFVLPTFGFVNGAPAGWRGLHYDSFEGQGEPNIVSFRRAWTEFGLVTENPSEIFSMQVL